MSDEIETIDKNPKSWAAWKMEAERLQAIIDDMAPAAMGSEPDRNPVLAYTDSYRDMAKQGVESVPIWSVITDLERNIAPLYRHAQQPVVMDDRKLRALFDSWFASDCSFDRSPEASEEDNIAWRESYWYVWQRCRAAMLQAGNSQVIPGAEKRISDAVELLKKAAPAMLADNSGPDGPLAGRLKSPVIPDGSAYMLRRWLAFGRGMQNAGSQLPHNLIAETESMLAAAPKPQNSPQNIPEIIPGWIPVSERMPETDGNYWGWWSESKRQGPVWFIKSELQAQFQSHEITHWMPLPAAPQEVKGE